METKVQILNEKKENREKDTDRSTNPLHHQSTVKTGSEGIMKGTEVSTAYQIQFIKSALREVMK